MSRVRSVSLPALASWLVAAGWGGVARAAGVGGGGAALPWEGPLNQILASFTGPVAKALCILAIVGGGGRNGTMKRKLLVVDDAKALHRLVIAWLADEALEIHSAYDGAGGIRMAKELQPDLILLDIGMPNQSGQDVCRVLKADPATRDIPVIFLTGVDSEEAKVRGLDGGAVDYVTKPFNPGELKARVKANLRTKDLVDGLNHKALVDPLTGLWNRGYFDERLTAERAAARRHGRTFSCVLVDVDHFKSVNDTWGHAFGDEVLKQVAAAVRGACRAEDVVCRYGGEEFAVILPDMAAGGAAAVAERVRLAVAGLQLAHQGKPVAVTCSAGVAEECEGLPIVERADAALYQSKQAGRNRVVAA